MTIEIIRPIDNEVICTFEDTCIDWDQLKVISDDRYMIKCDGKETSYSKLKENMNVKEATEPNDECNKNYSLAVPGRFVIRCLETGETFNKQSEAAKHFKIDPAQVSDSIKTGKKRSGYTFCKVQCYDVYA